MNLLQAEFKRLKDHKPEPCVDYIVTDGRDFAVAHYINGLILGFWAASNVEPTRYLVDIELDFEPTHFAEIKTGETE